MVLADDFGDEGLADGHFALGRKAPVEAVRDDSAGPRAREERFEADDFPPDPGGLGLTTKRDVLSRFDSATRAGVSA